MCPLLPIRVGEGLICENNSDNDIIVYSSKEQGVKFMSETVGIRPSFNIDSGLSPLNEIASFSAELQPKIIQGLRMAVDMLPTGDEYYAARKQGGSGEWRMENKYGVAADAFARMIDPQYDPRKGVSGNSTETVETRSKFYRMIRTLVSEQIHRGLSELKQKN